MGKKVGIIRMALQLILIALIVRAFKGPVNKETLLAKTE